MADIRTALVTGGAGFIGSHLVDRLLSLGYRVVVVDNLSTGKLKNLNPAATFLHVDVTTPGSLDDVFKREDPKLVFHLAAQISVSNSTRDPVHDANVNVVGTLRLLEAIRWHGHNVDKLVYSSTGGALYGDPEVNPCSEGTPIKPLSPYGLSKYLAEEYLSLYQRLFHLNYTCLRYGNVYGPRQDPNGEAGVVAIFTLAMLDGKQPTIFGNGKQERDFVYVSDVVEANIAAITRGDGEAINVGTGEGSSVNQVFDLLKGYTGYKWPAEKTNARPGDVYKISLDYRKATQALDWQPKVGLEQGLRQTVEYFQKAVKAAG